MGREKWKPFISIVISVLTAQLCTTGLASCMALV